HIDDQQTVDVVNAWAQVLDLLEHNPAKLADRLDWIAKYQLLNGMRERHGLDWSNAKLGMLDLQWADLRQDKGHYHTLAARGAMRTIVNNEQIQHAINFPPTTTRAWARGRLIERFGAHLAGVSRGAASVRPFGTGLMHRIQSPDPHCATAEA